MKIIYGILISLVCLNSNISQPEITEDWFYNIGDTTLTFSTSNSSLAIPSGGINFTWDISEVESGFFFGENEKIWTAANELTYFDEFPDATLGFKSNYDIERFYKVEDGELKNVGNIWPQFNYKSHYYNGTPVLAYADFSYGETSTTTYTNAKIDLTTLDTTFYQITDELSFDGFGTVITPIGTYENCVMTKFTRTGNSSSINEYTEYRFHKDRLSNVIAAYKLNGPNVEPSRFVWYKVNRIATSLTEPNTFVLEIARTDKNTIYLNSTSVFDAKVQMVDVSGRLLLSQDKNIFIGDNEIDISQFPSSNIYFLLITNAESGAFKTFKIYK